VETNALPASQPVTAHAGLSERDAAVIAFEREWWRYGGAKETAIRERLGLSAVQYYQVLNALLDSPEALAAEPMLVKRLRRLRESRQRGRGTRQLETRLAR
jgi:hypothetical protein